MAASEEESRFTVRCPLDVRARVDAAAARVGQSSTEWVRRAILEKLEREEAGGMPSTREELEAFVRMVIVKREAGE